MDTLTITSFFIVNKWVALVGLREFSIRINAEDFNFKLKEIWPKINIYWNIICKKSRYTFEAHLLETESEGDALYKTAAKHDTGEGRKSCITTTLTQNSFENMDAMVWFIC